MGDENQLQQTSGQENQPEKIQNVDDLIKELRAESAARRVENNDLKAILGSLKDMLGSGQATPPETKTEKGKELSNEMQSILEGYNQRLGAAEQIKTEFETLKTQLESERQEREKAQLEAVKIRIGAKYGIPEKLMGRLQGSTPEEIENDAKELAAVVVKRIGILGNPGEATPPSQAKTIYERARGGNTNPFDPSIQGTTGGVGGKPE